MTRVLDELQPRPERIDVDRAVRLESWTWSEGTATTVDEQGRRVPVPAYAVIEGHARLLYAPANDLSAPIAERIVASDGSKGSLVLAVMSTTEPLVEPKLAPGTYYVVYRGSEEPLEPSLGVRKRRARVTFVARDGQAKAWIPAPTPALAPPLPSRVAVANRSKTTKVTIEAWSGVESSNEGLACALELHVARGAFDER